MLIYTELSLALKILHNVFINCAIELKESLVVKKVIIINT